jgi:hypothetical protein
LDFLKKFPQSRKKRAQDFLLRPTLPIQVFIAANREMTNLSMDSFL